jgi:hypothetical protein
LSKKKASSMSPTVTVHCMKSNLVSQMNKTVTCVSTFLFFAQVTLGGFP